MNLDRIACRPLCGLLADAKVALVAGVVIGLVLMAWSDARAQKKQPSWLRFEQPIENVVQDGDGFIWFSRQGAGITRYDGRDFKQYRYDETDSTGLAGAAVIQLLTDEFGNLWVKTSSGRDKGGPRFFHLYDRKTDRFVRFDKPNYTPPYFHDDAGGHWYIEEPRAGGVLYKVTLDESDSNRWVSRKAILSDEPITAIWKTASGEIWLGCYDFRLLRFDPETEQVIKEYTPEPAQMFWNMWHADRYNWYSFHENDQGELFACSLGAGALRYNAESDAWEPLLYDTDGQGPQPITNLFVDRDGNHWFKHHLHDNELWRFDEKDKTFQKFETQNVPVMQDRQGSFWLWHERIWPYDDKVRLTLHENSFQLIGAEHGLASRTVRGLVPIDSSLFILSEEIYQYTPATDSLSVWLDLPPEVQSGPFFTMARDLQGDYWMSPWDEGVFRYDDRSGELEHFHPKNQENFGLERTNFFHTHATDSGMYFLGGGAPPWVYFYDFARQRFSPTKGIPDLASRFLVQDQVDNWWMLGVTTSLRSVSDTSRYFVAEDGGALRFFGIASDRQKYFWASNWSGLRRMDPVTMEVDHYELWEGLISGCYPDSEGNAWFYLPGRLGKLDPTDGHISYYTAEDGMYLEGEPGLSANATEMDGWLYFAGANGVLRFQPEKLSDNSYVPPVHLTELRVNNKLLSVGDTCSNQVVLSSSLLTADKITLPPAANLTLKFAALNYENPEGNQYRYQLVGYDQDWVDAGNQRMVTYTNLWEGTYTFQVMGSNNHRVWNPVPTTIEVVVMPPAWRTWWAYSIYVMVLLGLLVGARELVVRRERLRGALELERLELDKIKELDDLKTQFFTNISHEFRTPLTLILGPLQKMREGTFKGDSQAIMDIMLRNAKRLLNLINQLLDLSKLDAGKLALKAQKVDLIRLSKQIAANYEPLAASRHIFFSFLHRTRELQAWVDVDKYEQIIHNLLSNAFKFTPDEGEISLFIRKRDSDWIEIEVADSGPGIPPEQQEKIFDRFHQADGSITREQEGTGIGMAVVKELVSMHHGEIRIVSTGGLGAKFVFTLPSDDRFLSEEEKIFDEMPHEIHEPPPGVSEMGAKTVPVASTDTGKTLLVVEDNADMRAFIGLTLAEEYQIQEASSGQEGLDTALESQPDLVITDVMMAHMDGITLCQKLKADVRTSHIPVIMLSAKADRDSRLAGLEMGADDYLYKPFDEEELRLLIKNRIEQRSELRKKFQKSMYIGPQEVAVNSVDQQFLRGFIEILERRMADPDLSMEDLADEVGMSLRQLNRKLTAMTGFASSQFVRSFRLKRAAHLLGQKTDNISQIAYAVGFNNLSYFTRSFKEEFGVTPRRFVSKSRTDT